jgi:predicted dithiol-disulfide oxidoreductase (DUF899 family)
VYSRPGLTLRDRELATVAMLAAMRGGDRIHRSYYTTARAAEELSSVWGLLDITPFGRHEEWQDAPDGVPQDPTGTWTRRAPRVHAGKELAGGRPS